MAPTLVAIPLATTILAVAPIVWVARSSDAGVSPALAASALIGCAVATSAIVSVVRRTQVGIAPGDIVTLLRAGLVGACCGWAVLILAGEVPMRSWWLIGLAITAWLLDGLDGWAARRSGTASLAGARFDMEIDALLVAALSLALAPLVGWWVLAIGAMRYLWALAQTLVPPRRAPLRASRFRRVAAACQGGLLSFALLPLVPISTATAACVGALLLLVVSFGRDAVWSWRPDELSLPSAEAARRRR